MILDATPLDNPTPELIRLRATLRPPEWEAFRAWMDLDIKRIDQLEDATEADGEPSAPVIRALYVFETWGELRLASNAVAGSRETSRESDPV